MSTTINYYNSIKAELIKSKSVSIFGLILFCLAFVITIVITANYMDVYNRVSIGTNPWDKYFLGSLAIYVLFVMSPFIILLVSAISYIEEKANGWKFMYTMNVSRTQTYLSKLMVILIMLFCASILLGLLILMSGYTFDFFLPEYEFLYYQPNIYFLAETIGRALVSCLGAIALQYMISVLTKNVILSLGIGVFGFIIAFIFAFSDTSLVLYNPYALVMIDQDFGAIDSVYKVELLNGFLSNVELYSIIFFILFTALGCFYENRKNIS